MRSNCTARKGLTVLFCGLALSPNCLSASLSAELTARSDSEGLGIAHLSGPGMLEIMSFHKGRPTTALRIPDMDGLYDIEPTHMALLVSRQAMPDSVEEWIRRPPGPLLGIVSRDGRNLGDAGLRAWPRLAVISHALDLVAALFIEEKSRRASLQYGPTAWTQSREIYSVDLGNDPEDPHFQSYRAEAFSWSRDGRSLAYSARDAVYIFDTESAQSRKIGAGSDPCWAPDGSSIVFRSTSHALVLYSVSTGRTEKLTTGIEVVGFPRWSPDSKYVLFTRYSLTLALRHPSTMPTTEFTVMRVEDRAAVDVYTPAMGMDNRRFYWIEAGLR